jgi:hypothetical protein
MHPGRPEVLMDTQRMGTFGGSTAAEQGFETGLAPTKKEKVQRTMRRLSHGTPSKPVLGLPIARVVPQDVHSIADYMNGLAVGAGYFLTKKSSARAASGILGASVVLVSALTDYRLSVAKVIPIEAHEVADHLWGISCIAAPFVFGYWKKAPQVAITHVVTGVMTIAASLFTDYRAERGIGRRAIV